jgi:hypothetical protein
MLAASLTIELQRRRPRIMQLDQLECSVNLASVELNVIDCAKSPAN